MGKTKTVDQAKMQSKLSLLEPRLEELLKRAEAETDPKKN